MKNKWTDIFSGSALWVNEESIFVHLLDLLKPSIEAKEFP